MNGHGESIHWSLRIAHPLSGEYLDAGHGRNLDAGGI